MKRVNKILILFLFVMSISLFGIWKMLQSEWVADRISTLATGYIREVLHAEVKFNNLEFNLFPPGARVKDIKIVGQKEGISFSAEADSLGVYFNPLDSFKTDFIIDKIIASEGYVEIKTTKQAKKKKGARESKFDLDNLELIKKLPIKRVIVSEYIIKVNSQVLTTNFLEVKNLKEGLRIDTSFENIPLDGYGGLPRKTIDQVKIQAKIDRGRIEIDSLKMKSGFVVVEASGNIQNYVSKNIKYNLKYKLSLPVNTVHEWVSFEDVGLLAKGICVAEGTVRGQSLNVNAESIIKLKNFETDFLNGDAAELKISINNERILFEKFIAKKGKQEIKLLKPFEFYNFKENLFVEEPIIAQARTLKFNNFLRYLKDDVSLIKGDITGVVQFDLYPKSFKFEVKDDLKVNNFKIVGGKLEILALKEFTLSQGEFLIDQGVFSMSVAASTTKSNFSIIGKISKNQFALKMPLSYLDLDDFKNIVGEQVKGRGTFSFNLDKTLNGLVLATKNDFKNISIRDYALEKVKGRVNYLLANNLIELEHVRASFGKSRVHLRGFYNYGNQDVGATYEITQLGFGDVKKILKPLLGQVKINAADINGRWSSKGKISGKATLEDLIVEGTTKGVNSYFFNENIDQLALNYHFNHNKFEINNLRAKKSTGTILGGMKFDFANETHSFDLDILNSSLQDSYYYARLPLALKGKVSGKLKGSFSNNKFSFNSKIKIHDAYVLSKRYKDSDISIEFDDEVIKFDANAFSNKVKLNTQIYPKRNALNKSNLNLSIRTKKINELFGVFNGVDLANSGLTGEVDYQLTSQFDFNTLNIKKIESNLKRFKLEKKPVSVDYSHEEPEIIVVNGKVEAWDMNVRGKKFYVMSKGQGNLNDKYITTTLLKTDASLLEVFNSLISKANGNIRGKIVYENAEDKNSYEAYLTSNNLSLVSEHSPFSINKGDFKISFIDKTIHVEKFSAALQAGSFDLKGKINLKQIIPDINLKYEFKDAGVTILKKSNLVFSGNGTVLGKTFPYALSGDFYIQNFILINELTDFQLGDGEYRIGDIEYLPGQKNIKNNQFLNLNINVSTREPVFIRNTLADLGFLANLHVQGGEKEPRVSGEVSLALRNNKIKFKNNEFILTKGNVIFNASKDYKNPELDFVATTNINDIKIDGYLRGPVSDYNFLLSSDPALPQSDILSLIIFGYSEDLSSGLSDSEKESMTRAGVGSILFDSFKINETLKQEFGLQINLGTEISKEEGSYLSQRNSSSGSSSAKVHSATTWEIKKKLNEAMSMSVTGTVGSSVQQKKSVNLNYKINKSVSVEGVYETVSTDDAQAINDGNSVGTDVKWKWSFK